MKFRTFKPAVETLENRLAMSSSTVTLSHEVSVVREGDGTHIGDSVTTTTTTVTLITERYDSIEDQLPAGASLTPPPGCGLVQISQPSEEWFGEAQVTFTERTEEFETNGIQFGFDQPADHPLERSLRQESKRGLMDTTVMEETPLPDDSNATLFAKGPDVPHFGAGGSTGDTDNLRDIIMWGNNMSDSPEDKRVAQKQANATRQILGGGAGLIVAPELGVVAGTGVLVSSFDNFMTGADGLSNIDDYDGVTQGRRIIQSEFGDGTLGHGLGDAYDNLNVIVPLGKGLMGSSEPVAKPQPKGPAKGSFGDHTMDMAFDVARGDVKRGNYDAAIEFLTENRNAESHLLKDNPWPELNGTTEQIQGRIAAFDQEINRLKDLRASDLNGVKQQWETPLSAEDLAMLDLLGVKPVKNQPRKESQPVQTSQPAHEGGGSGYADGLDLVDNPFQAGKQRDFQHDMDALGTMSPAELEAWLAKNFPADGK